MPNWFFKLEIIDNNNNPYVIDTENRGYKLKLEQNNKSTLIYNVRNINNIKPKIVYGNEVTVYGDYNNSNPTTKQFTGVNLEMSELGTYKQFFSIFTRDLFNDRRLSRDVNKKYADQDVAITVKDIVDNFMGGGFNTASISNIGISQPFNFVSEPVDHALVRASNSSFGEIFMKADKSVIYRYRQTEDSGITITDANIVHPELVDKKSGISETFGIIRVIGGLDSSGKRVLAESRIPNAPASYVNRVFNHPDDRFTTWRGAKAKSLTLANDLGKERKLFTKSFDVKDLPSLPRPGTLVNINSSTLGITNEKYVVYSILIDYPPGHAGIETVSMTLGDTEQGELESLQILEEIYESEKRKSLDADAITNQSFFSVPIKFAPTLTVTITVRDKVASPYLWGDGTNRASDFKWSFWTWMRG